MKKTNFPKKQRVIKSSVIDHSYQDYADALVQPDGSNENDHAPQFQPTKLNFPAKLHKILSTPEYQHIIGWMCHGRSWEVKDKMLFVSVVLNKHFDHGNFDSFNRQVNLWGFKRLHRPGPDVKTYYHEAFLRGRSDLTQLIHRRKNEGKRIPNIETEPDFYQMPFLPPLPQHHKSSESTKDDGSSAEQQAVDDLSQNYQAAKEALKCEENTTQRAVDHLPQNTPHSAVEKLSQSYQAARCNVSSHSHWDLQLESIYAEIENDVQKQSAPEIWLERKSGNIQQQSAPHSWESNGGNRNSSPDLDRKPAAKQKAASPDSGMAPSISSNSNKHQVPPAAAAAAAATPSVLLGRQAGDFSTKAATNSSTTNTIQASSRTASTKTHNPPKAASAPKRKPVKLSIETIAMLSNPPDDPLIREFAEQYLPYFEQCNDSSDESE